MPSVTVTADLSKIGAFAKTLEKESASVLRWRIRQAVNDVGGNALRRAKTEAATFSTKIPPQVTLKTSFGARSAGVTIATNLKRVPYARLYERGSKGSGGRYIKHPVFGSNREGASGDVRARYDDKSTWRKMNSHPFFYKSVYAEKDELKHRLVQEISNAFHELGFSL